VPFLWRGSGQAIGAFQPQRASNPLAVLHISTNVIGDKSLDILVEGGDNEGLRPHRHIDPDLPVKRTS